ncbi:S9 family peptidase [Marinoscillum sp.]|uniref:S9 family peptidase n=1 Tax=Marinoscillum sp. TaxID=2024838 RepID=UPI003BAB54A7
MKYYLSCLLLAALFIASAQKQISVDNITDRTFSQQSVRSVNWMNDGQFYSALSQNKVQKYDVTTGEVVEVIVDGEKLDIAINDYRFSADESQVLLLTERKSIYRRSFTAVYYVYDRTSSRSQKLSDGVQSYATFSPDGSKIAFTRDNNLFYKDLASGREVAITTDGEFNKIINGSSDWVYEEELYITKAFEWSVDSKKIVYYRFDESNVKEYNMPLWNDAALYPEDYVYKYPKAGEDNSVIELFVYHLDDAKNVPVNIGEETDIYIPRVYWTEDANLISVQRLNRLQNKLDILHVNASTGDSKVVLTDQSETYIDFTFCDDLTYLENGKQFLFSSEKSGYKHFYLYNMDGSLVRQVTSGEFEAVSLVGLDQSPKTPVLYYTSTEVSALERHFYSIDLKGKNKKKLSAAAGTSYINMSNDCSYYMNYHSAADQPLSVSLYKTAGNQLIKVLEDNADLAKVTEDYGLSDKEFFTFKTENGTSLNGFYLKPKDFSAGKEYPVLLYQYSGPGSQNVSNSWSGSHFIFHQYLVQQGYIVAVVDTRGTGYRGEAFKKTTYKQLGKYETEDLIATGKFLASQPFIDAKRVGVWGWSYGGYMSSLAILKGSDVFSTAIAVAPVTTWRFYDTIYTERYLQRPQDNASGYDDNSPIFFADQLKGKFLLVHGTGDDNVHFQNAIALQNELIKADKQFESFYYPDKAHSLSGRRGHLYQMMADFLLENL